MILLFSVYPGLVTEKVQTDLSFSRSQTTKGIWLARCAGIEPCTLVMDLEGTDGRERGEVRFCAFIFLGY